MYRCTKFQLIWRTSDFGTKFAPKNMNEWNFEKINVKIVITIYQCTTLQIFNSFGELQILGQICSKKYE